MPGLQVGIALKIGVSQFPLVNRFPRLDSHRRFTSVSCGHQQAHGGGRGWLQAKPKMKYEAERHGPAPPSKIDQNIELIN